MSRDSMVRQVCMLAKSGVRTICGDDAYSCAVSSRRIDATCSECLERMEKCAELRPIHLDLGSGRVPCGGLALLRATARKPSLVTCGRCHRWMRAAARVSCYHAGQRPDGHAGSTAG